MCAGLRITTVEPLHALRESAFGFGRRDLMMEGHERSVSQGGIGSLGRWFVDAYEPHPCWNHTVSVCRVSGRGRVWVVECRVHGISFFLV